MGPYMWEFAGVSLDQIFLMGPRVQYVGVG